jgi:type I restriction enzyme R subunit
VDITDLLPPGAEDIDQLDVLLQVAWNFHPRTRAERACRARETHHAELEARSEVARSVLSTLLDRYAASGIDEVTSPEGLRLPPISDLGLPREIDNALGDAGGLRSVIDQVQDWIYSNESVA